MTHNLLCKCMENTPIPQVMHYISRPDNFHKKALIEQAVASNLLLYLACNSNMVQPMLLNGTADYSFLFIWMIYLL